MVTGKLMPHEKQVPRWREREIPIIMGRVPPLNAVLENHHDPLNKRDISKQNFFPMDSGP